MHTIDRYAYLNRIRAVDPARKGSIALCLLVLCLLLNEPVVSVLTITWSVSLAVGWAGLPMTAFGRVLLAESMFLCLSVISIAITGGAGSVPDTVTWSIGLRTFWIGTSAGTLWAAFDLLARTLGCVSALNFVIMTTPLVDLIELGRRLHVPVLLLDLMTLIYTSIFVLLDSIGRISTAQRSRAGYASWRHSFSSAALLGSRLFIDAYQRSQRMQQTLSSRGYDGGHLVVLPLDYRQDRLSWWLISAMIGSLILAWIIV